MGVKQNLKPLYPYSRVFHRNLGVVRGGKLMKWRWFSFQAGWTTIYITIEFSATDMSCFGKLGEAENDVRIKFLTLKFRKTGMVVLEKEIESLKLRFAC